MAYSGRRHPDGGIKATLTGGNTVGGVLREREPRADGYRHIDTPAMIRRLREANANTFLYGIWDSPTDWDDLRLEFIAAAATAGIDVIPYLVPPSETFDHGRASRPYRLDFVRWATEIAALSLKYPNLVGWAIDDFEFAQNAELFTAEYMTEFTSAQKEINPALGFYTCAYYTCATSETFLDKYRPFIDGIIYPFLDGHNENTTVAASTGPCLDEILRHTQPRGLDLILLVYTGRFLNAPLEPTEGYVAEVMRVGAEYAADGRIAGVIAYGAQVDNAPTPSTDNRAMYGNGRLSLFSAQQPVSAGAYACASQVVRVVGDLPRYELSFWYHRAFLARGCEPGSFELRVRLDDAVVWRMDLAHQQWNLWMNGNSDQGPVDVTEHVRGKSVVTLTFSVVALRDVPDRRFLDVGVDAVSTIGLLVANPDFEEEAHWRLSSSGGPLVATFDVYVPDRPARIYSAIANAFAG
jgi:hypothetical protein